MASTLLSTFVVVVFFAREIRLGMTQNTIFLVDASRVSPRYQLTSRVCVRLNGFTDLNSYFLISDSNARGTANKVEMTRQRSV